jgi:glycogen(starch) synthase
VQRVSPPSVNDTDFYTLAWQANLRLEQAAADMWNREGAFDLVHAHDWLAAFSACALKRAFHAPLVATIHATERGRGRGSLPTPLSRAINDVEWWLSFEAWRVILLQRIHGRRSARLLQRAGR